MAVTTRKRMRAFRLPSAMSRNRLQSPQNALVIDVMKDTLPQNPGILKFLATSPLGSCQSWQTQLNTAFRGSQSAELKSEHPVFLARHCSTKYGACQQYSSERKRSSREYRGASSCNEPQSAQQLLCSISHCLSAR